MAIILISFAYSRFATQQILQESIEHLEEIYNQINDNFRSTVSKNWRLLRSWKSYIANSAEENPDGFTAFIEEEREDWHFSTFYFLAENGDYITSRGWRGNLDLGEENMRLLMEEQRDIVVDCTAPNAPRITVFAVPGLSLFRHRLQLLFGGYDQSAEHQCFCRAKRLLCHLSQRTCAFLLPN